MIFHGYVNVYQRVAGVAPFEFNVYMIPKCLVDGGSPSHYGVQHGTILQ